MPLFTISRHIVIGAAEHMCTHGIGRRCCLNILTSVYLAVQDKCPVSLLPTGGTVNCGILMVEHNETGFTAENMESLCRMCISNKANSGGNQYIGKKVMLTQLSVPVLS